MKTKKQIHPNIRAKREKEKLEQAKAPPKVDTTSKTVVLKYSEIEVDPSWNMRSGNWQEDTGTDEENLGFQGFVDSMRDGQDTAVVVRKNPKKNATKPWFLVSGYRRMAALGKLVEETKNPDYPVEAKIKELSEADARVSNIRENFLRENPKTPDLAWGVGELKKLGMSVAEIARRIGKSYLYTQKLAKIVSEVPKNVIEDWRKSPLPLSADKMLECVHPENGRSPEEEYKAQCKALSERPNRFQKSESNKLTDVCRRAYSLGEVFGELSREGFIDVAFGDYYDIMPFVVNLKGLPEGSRKEVAKSFEEGFLHKKNGKPDKKTRGSSPKESGGSTPPSGTDTGNVREASN